MNSSSYNLNHRSNNNQSTINKIFEQSCTQSYFPNTFSIDIEPPNQITQIQQSHRTINKSSKAKKYKPVVPLSHLVNILHKLPPQKK